MNRVRILTVLATVAVVLAASQWGFASSITFEGSSAPGVYDYGLTLAPGELVNFAHNATITLSGLSGVTGASVTDVVLPACFTVGPFTPSSAVYTQTVAVPVCMLDNGTGSPVTLGTLVVDSSVLTLGTVDFSMDTTGGVISGTVAGPVAAAVPEPASLVLLGTALLGLVGLARRRWSR